MSAVQSVAPAVSGVPAVSPASAQSPEEARLVRLLRSLEQPLYVIREGERSVLSERPPADGALVGLVPAVPAQSLGSERFRATHGLRFAYLTGAMAGGIASADLVIAMGRAGFMGFFGSGGMPVAKVEEAIGQIQAALPEGPYGFNLLHNHFEPRIEMETVELYLRRGVRCVDGAAFLDMTLPLVYFRAKGVRTLPDGRIAPANRVFAKISRPEVASRFMAPPPEALLRELVQAGKLTEEEARLAAKLPIAEDITAEADSGGHTDQRPLPVLIPLILDERERAMQRYGYAATGREIRVGAAGGIGEPLAAHAAFALGADYLMTGSINQACRESGTSDLVKKMLLEADMADVAMAPAPDMFEMGARVQVLRRGTLYPQRAQKLYEVYREHPSFEAVPVADREKVEKQILRRPFAEVWADTERYWQARDPKKAEEGRTNPKARMALCFRWYLGMASRWASLGDESRRMDFQIWCGASIGSLNRWTKGSPLETLEGREAPVIGRAILTGAAALARRDAALRAGVKGLPSATLVCRP